MQKGDIIKVDEDGRLICPNCGMFNLHQGQVIVEDRESEDGTATRTVCNGKRVRTESGVTNVAGRRDNIYITFYCEDCSTQEKNGQELPDKEFTLMIQQHKGPTYLKWIE
jgi:hypothetical protein